MDIENFDTFAVIDPEEYLTAAARKWLAMAERDQEPGDLAAETLTCLARKWLEA
jgi:hypothetical protein